ncbi:MAG: divergent polysaccharide deacetylase family protein [Candidatus Edwardsbacteria bacterium]|nr:divergent polysaccharide deacetylase family protein [Candidatus Edwardsbacteria bacterium]MBU1575850.1 divergent polysaccharide deacetylase family protein [Candidatus Edwardsbacteria bacterium]MBU2463636.1 divergent polysaccharide deacetylase family protein [Candidatus Edwardsbacteria bacterium]MBU2593064.1 divergent polysaccharide deacetylase family protein [Candidatus Edwardsbacteria bacterium]
MPRNRKKKRSNLWIVPAAALVLLAAFGLRHFVGRPQKPVLPEIPKSQAFRPATGDIQSLLGTLTDQGFTVRALSPGADSSRNFLIYIPPGYPLIQANLMINRLALSQNYTPVRSLENRKKQRLDLAFLSRDSLGLNITVLKKRAPAENISNLPKIALVLYFWPPEKPSLSGQFDKIAAIKTVIIKGSYRSKDREAICTVTLEPKGYPRNDPGPGTILVDDPSGKIKNKLDDAATAADEPAGLYLWQGSRAVEDARITDMITSYCSRNQLILIEPYPSAQSLVKKSAGANSCSYITPDLVIDTQASANSCLSQLKNQLAKTKARSLILIPATENGLKALNKVLTTETASHYEFVAVSGMM